MPTTPNMSFPYPDDEDWLNGGAYAVQQLAERLDVVTNPNAGLIVARSDTNVDATVPTVVSFDGTVLGQVDFAFDGSTFTYNGPGICTVLIDVEVTMRAQGVSPSTTVELRAGGVSFAGSYDAISAGDGTVFDRSHTHRITTPARLSFGDALDVVATGGTIDARGLRIYQAGAHT